MTHLFMVHSCLVITLLDFVSFSDNCKLSIDPSYCIRLIFFFWTVFFCSLHLSTSLSLHLISQFSSSFFTPFPPLFSLFLSWNLDPVSLLEVEVTDLDRRVGLCLGSTDEVSRFKRYLFNSSAYTRFYYTSEDNTRSYDSW